MKIKCRQWKREGSEREVDHWDYEGAADVYVNEFVRMEIGTVTFVEVLTDGADGEWVIWDVEKIGPGAYFTKRTDAKTAEREISEASN